MLQTSKNKEKIKPILKKILPIIGLIGYICIIMVIGPEKITNTFSNMSIIALIIVALLTIPKVLIGNYQWQLILKKQKINISFLKSLKIHFIGQFYCLFGPWKIGNFVAAMHLKEETNQPYGKMFISTFIKQVIVNLAFYSVGILCVIYTYDIHPEISILIFIYIIANFLFYFYFCEKERGQRALNKLVRHLIPKKFRNNALKFTSSFYNDFPKFKDFIIPFLISFIILIITCSQIYIIALSIGITLPILIVVLVHFIASLSVYIPISFFQGAGIRDIGLVYLYSLYGVGAEKAIAISLASSFLLLYLPALYGGILSFNEGRTKKTSLKKDLKPSLG